MKLTKRDKKLLSFLGVVVVLYLFGQFLILPALERSWELSDKVAQAELEKEQMQMKIVSLPQERAMNETLNEEFAQKAREYYPILTSQEADREVTGIFLKYGMEIESLAISMPTEPTARKPYQASEMARKQEEARKAAEQQAAQTEAAQEETKETEAVQGEVPAAQQSQIYVAEVSLKCSGTPKKMEELIDFLTNENPAVSVMKYSYEQRKEEVRVNEDGELEKAAGPGAVLNITLQLSMCDRTGSGIETEDAKRNFAPADIRPADGQPTEEEIARMEAEAESEAQSAAEEGESESQSAAEESESEPETAAEQEAGAWQE